MTPCRTLRHLLLALTAGLCALPGLTPALAQGLPAAPPSHVVLVIMENRSDARVLNAPDAPYLNRLSRQAAVFTRSFAITHPSQPNYLALFSGSTHRVDDNRCPLTLQAPNLAQQLLDQGKSFIAYSEGLPETGFGGCSAPTGYVRKHAPWTNFTGLPRQVHQPWSAFPKGRLEQLPTVAFVVPNLDNDMHDGSVAQGDAWLKSQLDGYVKWSRTHNALLILTWDEDEGNGTNQIATLMIGPMIKPGQYAQPITHYSVLRTLQALYKLPFLGEAAKAQTIVAPWLTAH